MPTRETPSRFKVGDTVIIESSFDRRFNGMTGVVLEVKLSPHLQTLDKYVVRLADQKTAAKEFWDVEVIRSRNTN